ncbi:MAG: hypothetical protein JSR58_05195 [Verrucomicrobia bacterium]|nr:hypothetical protein [Verrucomicrobiota bacterium]
MEAIRNKTSFVTALESGDDATILALKQKEADVPVQIPDFLKNAPALFECLFKPQLSPMAIGFSTTIIRRIIWQALSNKPELIDKKLVEKLKPILQRALISYKDKPPIVMEFIVIQTLLVERTGKSIPYAACFKKIEEIVLNNHWLDKVSKDLDLEELCDEVKDQLHAKFPLTPTVEERPVKRQKLDPLTPYLIAVDTNPQMAVNWTRLGTRLAQGGKVTLHNKQEMFQWEIFFEAYKLQPKVSIHLYNLGYALPNNVQKIRLVDDREMNRQQLFAAYSLMEPTDEDALVALAITLKEGETDPTFNLTKKQLLEKVLAMNPQSERALLLLKT